MLKTANSILKCQKVIATFSIHDANLCQWQHTISCMSLSAPCQLPLGLVSGPITARRGFPFEAAV